MRLLVLLVDGVADSGLALLQDVVTGAELLAPRVDRHLPGFSLTVRAATPRVRTAYGRIVDAEPLAAALDDPPDHVLVPGFGLVGAAEVIDAVASSDALPVLRALHEGGVPVAAACSGTFVLAESGLLDEREATTSWWLGPAFRHRYPRVRMDEGQAVVTDGPVTTAGAALGHLDLALALVHQASPALADAVSDYLAVGDRPQQGDVVRVSLLPTTDPVLVAFDRRVRDGLAEAIDVGTVAAAIGVSQRTLQRLTARVLGMTPVRYVQQVRLERAVELLRTTDAPVAVVARAVGYQDATTLSTLIRRRRGTTPEQLRRRGARSRQGA